MALDWLSNIFGPRVPSPYYGEDYSSQIDQRSDRSPGDPRYMRQSRHGEDFVKGWEQFRDKAYNIGDGRYTIGWGHAPTGKNRVRKGDTVTLEQGNSIYNQDVEAVARDIREQVKVPLTQGQYDTLVSFGFNSGTGSGTWRKAIADINAGKLDSAIGRMGQYTSTNPNLKQGVVNRRIGEKEQLWNSPHSRNLTQQLGDASRAAEMDASRELRSQQARMGFGPTAPDAVADIFGSPPAGQPSRLDALRLTMDEAGRETNRGQAYPQLRQKPLDTSMGLAPYYPPERPASPSVPPPQNPPAAPPPTATAGLANGSPLSQAPPPAGLPAAGGTANNNMLSPNTLTQRAPTPPVPGGMPPAAPPSPAQGLPMGAQSPAPVPPPNAMAGLPGPSPASPVPPPSPIMGREAPQFGPPMPGAPPPGNYQPGAVTSQSLPPPPGAPPPRPITSGPVVDSVDKRIALQSPFGNVSTAPPSERLDEYFQGPAPKAPAPPPSPMMGRRQSLSDASFDSKLPGFADAMQAGLPPPPAPAPPKPPQTSLYQGPFVDQTMTAPVRNVPPPPAPAPPVSPSISPASPQNLPTPSAAKPVPPPSLPALDPAVTVPSRTIAPAQSVAPPAPPAPPPASQQMVQQQKAPLAAKLAGTMLGGVAGLATGGGLLGMLAGGVAGNRLANRFFRGSDGRLRDSSGRLVDDHESRGMGSMGMPGGGLGYGNGRGYAGGSIGSGIGGAINPNR